MPSRVATHDPFPGAKPRNQLAELHRGSARERGYTWDWEQAAKAHRQSHPLCVLCEQAGRLTPAECVDHVIPHKGDMALFWDRGNWQSLCGACHTRKTWGEDRRFRYQGAGMGDVTIVCGPPGAGKTTYVREHMHEGDLVLDLDAIYSAISLQPWYVKPPLLLPYVLNVQELLLHRLANDETRPRAWIVTMGAKRADRLVLAERLKGRVVMLAAPAAECIDRIRNDLQRQGSMLLWERLVRGWWADYEPVESMGGE